MSENFDGVVTVIPTENRYLESVKNVEERQGISQFPNRLLRFKRKASVPSGLVSTSLKLAKTEADIQPNGGTGPTRCYSSRVPVGTPYVSDSGEIIAELLWMDNDEQVSDGIEVLLAFFADLKQTDGTTGADFTQGNSDYVEVYADTSSTTRLSWNALNGSSFIEFTANFTDFSDTRPILCAYDDNTDPVTTAANSSALFFSSSVAGQLRWHIGGQTSGVNSVASLSGFGLADGTDHLYRIEHDGAGVFTMYRDNVLFDTDTITLASGGWIDSPMDIGRWDRLTLSDKFMDGTMKDFKCRANDDWLFFLGLSETSGTAIADTVGVGSGVLSSGDSAAVWAQNAGAGKSGWLIIGADCESQADTTGTPV